MSKKKTEKSVNSEKAKKVAKPAVKQGVKQTTPKKNDKKKTAITKPTKAKKQMSPKKTAADKSHLKHNDSEEMTIGNEKIVVINSGGVKKQKKTPKVLRRVNKAKGGYTAWDARTGKTFATEKEAKDYALDVMKKTGLIIPVTPTDRQVTHTFKSEEEKKKKR